jgi:hypothetical protein
LSELLPVLSGLVLGFVLALVRRPLRLPLGAVVAVALGALATVVSGEYQISWAFILVDVPLVALSAVAGFLAARNALRFGRRPEGGV